MCKLEFQDSKLYKLRLAAVFLVFSQIAVAQTVSTLGLELGISFSRFPKHETGVILNNGFYKIKDNPLPGPLIGISKYWNLSKHLQLTSGLQYQIAGTRYHYYQRSGNPYDKNDSWINLTIHKICIPLDLGYGFKIGKIRPYLYLGVRPNIWLSAKEYNGYENYDGIRAGGKENLFDNNFGSDYKPPKRLVFQYSIGLTTPIGQHIKINLSYNIGHNYSKDLYVYHGNHSNFSYPVKKSIISSDYIISVVYYFNRSESKNLNNKNE